MASQKDPTPNIDVTSPYIPRRPSPLISISVNHPLATAARKVKNFLTHKQTLFSTTFSIKITPIVAIVSLFGLVTLFGGGITTAYQFGKTVEQRFLAMQPSPTPIVVQPTPAPVLISRAGVLKATYQVSVLPTTIPTLPLPTSGNTSSDSSKTQEPTVIPSPTSLPSHYILTTSSTNIVFLVAPTSVNFAGYLNQRVLVTGYFDSTKNTLTVSKPADIELLGK